MKMKNFLVETGFERITPSISRNDRNSPFTPKDYPFPSSVKVPHNGALLGQVNTYPQTHKHY
jgi:hypothetical protein